MQQFKVGDWVRHIESNNIYKINGFSVHGQTKGFIQIPDEYNLVPQSECELWQPKEGEWCWFYNSTSLKREQRLARYKFANNGWYYDEYDTDWNHCEPFIGELPSFLKDKR